MVYIPSNFQDEWECVLVPNGIRCLVITNHNKTIVRSSDGQIFNTFQSMLPFGSETSREGGTTPSNQHCILDCVYDSDKQNYYVLDILSWKGYMLMDCDTEFRFFWKKTKLMETIEATKRSNQNPFPFLLPISCSTTIEDFEEILYNLNEDLSSKQCQYQPEFLLFYHKESHYEFGSTPLFTSLSIQYLEMLINNLKENDNIEEKEEELDGDEALE
ncbi:hypothetical protein CYY_010531 [Polysphondylium violaceum]|uniref:Snurportin-1 n=1 Tax=Polysphondylium violaceum TaxID=133409 RepID=A0A8J4UTR7_9MYCE|nr:hypothetical protein CYY_010531 [Polysphondylium violaceum]